MTTWLQRSAEPFSWSGRQEHCHPRSRAAALLESQQNSRRRARGDSLLENLEVWCGLWVLIFSKMCMGRTLEDLRLEKIHTLEACEEKQLTLYR